MNAGTQPGGSASKSMGVELRSRRHEVRRQLDRAPVGRRRRQVARARLTGEEARRRLGVNGTGLPFNSLAAVERIRARSLASPAAASCSIQCPEMKKSPSP